MNIAVLTDTHFRGDGSATETAERKGYWADLLMLRAVQRLNRLLKPDLVLFAGDLLDREDSPIAVHELQRMRKILDGLDMPYIIIPGNHDVGVNEFYRHLPKPPPQLDVNGVRVITFIDPEEPGYNARRLPADLERMRGARQGWEGPIVMLQHVPLVPPGCSNSPYNYANADDIIAVMKEVGIDLAISGHLHAGLALLQHEQLHFLAAPALCEPPFRLLQVQVTPKIEVSEHRLSIPADLHLRDWHVHSSFAYCSQNMSFAAALDLAAEFGLAEIGFAEHSGQLYYDNTTYWSGACLEWGTAGIEQKNLRMHDFFNEANAFRRSNVSVGLEADCCFDGGLLLRPQDRARADYIIGAIHQVPELQKATPDMHTACDQFLYMLEQMLQQRITILGHPFRVFKRTGQALPEALFDPVIRLLRVYACAAEINFHTNEPPLLFFQRCLDSGVAIALGSDSHNLFEVGDFALHLDLLRQCGCTGDIADVLIPVDSASLSGQT